MCTIMSYCGKTAAYKAIKDGLSETKSRGPDDERIIDTGAGMLGFQRLSIMGLTPEGMQPFELDGCSVVCNGELYGFEKLRKELLAKGYSFASGEAGQRRRRERCEDQRVAAPAPRAPRPAPRLPGARSGNPEPLKRLLGPGAAARAAANCSKVAPLPSPGPNQILETM